MTTDEPTYQQLCQGIIAMGTKQIQTKALIDELFATLTLPRNRELFAGHPHSDTLWKIVDEYKARYEAITKKKDGE